MFWGTDDGNHARVFVDNAEFRQHVGFDDAASKKVQFVLNDEVCSKMLELKTDSAFEKNIKEKVVMAHEKAILLAYCRKVKLNDYNKIQFIEQHTGEKF